MKRLISFFVAVIMIISINIRVMAAGNINNVNVDLKTKNYMYNRDVKLSGVYGSDTFYFNVDDSWKVKSAFFNLVFTQSDIILKNYSTLTVFINGNPAYSMSLDNGKNYKESNKVQIPVKYITSGYNELKIQIYRRMSDKPCTDDMNVANWLMVNKESYMHIDYQEKAPSGALSEFPSPFMRPSDEQPASGIMVIPDKFTKEEATAAMVLAANFGAKRKFDNINIKTLKYSEASEKAGSDIIFIGNKKDAPKEILALLSNDQIRSAENYAVIKEASSPYNRSKKILIIISNNGESLIKASKFLCNSDLVKEVNTDNITIDDKLNINDTVIDKDVDHKLVFKDLGYNSINLAGLFRQEATVTLSVPKNRVIKDGAKIVLNCRYSQNLDFDKSLATVYINDIPIGSKKLDVNKADDDSIEIAIPEEARQSSSYNITIAFDLELKDVYCTIKQEQMPWAYISNSSYVYLPYKEGKDFVFENYSNPFVANGDFNNTTVILPDNPSSQDLTMAANIMAYIGHDLNHNKGTLNVIESKDFSSKYYNSNLIVLGTPSSNKLINNLNDKLNVKFNKDFTSFEGNEQVNFIPDYGATLSTIQLIASPYNKDYKAMVFTAIKGENMRLAASYLCDSSLIAKLKGNVAIIDSYGNVNSYNFEKKTSSGSIMNILSSFSFNEQTIMFIIFFVFLILFIIAVSIFIIKKYKRDKR